MNKPAIEGGKPVRNKKIEAWPKFTDEEIKAVVEVLKSGRLSMLVGDKVKKFEKEFSNYIGVKHAIAVSNGTTALHTALAAANIGPGDEVITSPFTFISSASAILHQNAIPIFADINIDTFTLDPEDIKNKISDRTKGIVIVHLAGHPAEMDEIMKIAHEYDLIVIEDCAQAVGSEYKGKKVGSIGNLGAFSFYQSKNMTTGEGGMVTTDNDTLAERAKLIRHHGETKWYNYLMLGYNYRMTELQAVIGLGELKRLKELNRRREEIAKIYSEKLEGIEQLILPKAKPYVKHTWHIYEVLLRLEKLKVNRDFFVKALKAENVLVSIAYPSVLYLEPIFQALKAYKHGCPWTCPFYAKKISYKRGIAPKAEYIAERVITLPTYASLSDEDAIDIAKAVKKITNYYSKN